MPQPSDTELARIAMAGIEKQTEVEHLGFQGEQPCRDTFQSTNLQSIQDIVTRLQNLDDVVLFRKSAGIPLHSQIQNDNATHFQALADTEPHPQSLGSVVQSPGAIELHSEIVIETEVNSRPPGYLERCLQSLGDDPTVVDMAGDG